MGIFDPGPELIILIVIVIILIFGAKKIPELARSIGKAKGEFERGKREVEREIEDEETKRKTSGTSKTEDTKVIKAAKELGIDTEGKTEEELKKEIASKVADSP